MANVIPWTEISLFHNLRKYITAYSEVSNGADVIYRAKIKLHGSCAAVQCSKDGSIVTQSRTAILTPEDDFAGFAKWANARTWLKQDITIFGEWCGPGVQSGVAISAIPNKIFAVFAAQIPDSDTIIVEPKQLQELVAHISDVYVLPWFTQPSTLPWEMSINWLASDDELVKVTNALNKLVLAVEQQDPWVQATFNVEGTGEGLVFYPVSSQHLGKTNFNNLVFKAKGEKHRVTKTTNPTQITAETANSIDQFIELVLPLPRLEQGVSAVGGLEMKNVGKFIAWIASDVQKENSDELEASQLTWKQVQKPVADKARQWYLEQVKGNVANG
jgi:hypothetical protein